MTQAVSRSRAEEIGRLRALIAEHDAGIARQEKRVALASVQFGSTALREQCKALFQEMLDVRALLLRQLDALGEESRSAPLHGGDLTSIRKGVG